MPFVQDDYMVQTFPAQGSDQPLHTGILPRRSWRNHFLFHAQARGTAHKLRTVNAIAITQEKPQCDLKREGIDELLPSPKCRGCFSDSEVHHLPAFMNQNDEDEQHSLRHCRDCEEIDRGDLLRVVAEEGLPRLRRRARRLGTVSPDGGIGNLKPQLRQLIADAGTPPCRVGLPHLADQSDKLAIDWRPSAATRFPAPIEAKPGAMPADHRLRSDDHQRSFPARLHGAPRDKNLRLQTPKSHIQRVESW